MKNAAFLLNWILSRRYNIHLKGQELLKGDGIRLYLPNHQSEMDPVIIMTEIGKYHIASPMISSQYYNLPLINALMKKIRAVPVSDLDQGVRDVSVMDTIREGAINAFAEGKSILLYPSGQLTNQGYEKISNKQSAYSLVQDSTDEIQIIAIRINGLWGSMWSRAWIGVSPAVIGTFIKSVFLLIANLIFLMPKRRVEIEFVDITEEAKENANKLSRREFNEFLEKIYNVKGEENARFIKYHFLMPRLKRKLPERLNSIISDDVSSIVYTEIPKE